MDQDTNNQPQEESKEESALTELIPISRIGVETVLSRMPIHNLAKKGRVDIEITRRGVDGQVDLKWEVSYNEKYGQPRQLAYKLDTLVINRRIDDVARPVPRFIKLGTLNELCQELGSQKTELKRAIRQNATTSINAKLKYRSNDGSERQLEALFTRYSVYFTGEKFPDGRTADAVYIELNGPYREVLNNAPIRPLNYEYLKALPPAPQRFYEIISSRVYAALKNHNPFARILYSEFCTYSALTRHLDHENFRVQMSKILRPHLKAGYVARAQYEETKDGEGRADWMMCFAPGPRARAEYMTFARKRKQLEAKMEAQTEILEEQGSLPEPVEVPAPTPQPTDPLLAELTKRGIAASKGKKLLAARQSGQEVLDQLEWGDYLISSEPKKFKSPAGFYIYLISENVLPPVTFETSRQRLRREEAEAAASLQQLRQMELEQAYDDYKSAETEKYIRERLSESELQELTKRKRQHLAASMRNFALISQENAQRMVWGAVKAEIRHKVQFLSFAEFLAQREAQASLFAPEQGRGEVAVETPPVAQNLPLQEPQRAGNGETSVSVANASLKGNFEATATTPDAVSAVEADAALRKQYQEYRNRQATAVLDTIGMMERGTRLRAARLYLLNEHPDRDHHQELVSSGQYDEFQKLSQEHLLEETSRMLNLPDFDTWKQQQPPAKKRGRGATK